MPTASLGMQGTSMTPSGDQKDRKEQQRPAKEEQSRLRPSTPYLTLTNADFRRPMREDDAQSTNELLV